MIIPASREASTSTIPPPGVSYHTFLGLVWAGTGLSLICVLFRLYSRLRGPGRLYWDDVFVIFAEVLVIATAGLWQWSARFMYYVLDVDVGRAVPGPQIVPDLKNWLHVQLTVEVFFYTVLILVKLSFLFFFRRLGRNVQRQKYIWWPVLVFCVIGYAVSVGDADYKCFNGPLEYVETWCSSDASNDHTTAAVRANMALDAISDFMIMLIPITMLWNVQMPMKKKLAFIGLFSLSIITVVVAIVRAIHITSSGKGRGLDDVTFLWLWSLIQASLAIIVACLSAFPHLFSASAGKKKPAWKPTNTYYQQLRTRRKASNQTKDTLYDLSTMSLPGNAEPKPAFHVGDNTACWERSHDLESCDGQGVPVTLSSPTFPRRVVVCSGGCPGGDQDGTAPQGNEIRQEVEYRVTQQETSWEERMPQYHWVHPGQV